MMWTPSKHRSQFNDLKRSRTITSTGKIEGTFQRELTNNATRFLRECKIIIMTVVTDGQADAMKELLAAGLSANHYLVFYPGNLGSIECEEIINQMVIAKEAPEVLLNMTMFELSNSPYASRGLNASVFVSGIKAGLPASPQYANKPVPAAAIAAIDRIFGQRLDWENNIFAVGASGENLPIHVATCVVRWDELCGIDVNDPNAPNLYDHYQDSDEVEELQNGIDADMHNTLEKYGCDLPSLRDRMNKRYEMNARTYREFAKTSPAHNAVTMLPANLATYHRMYDEDITMGIVAVKTLALKAGVDTPSFDRVLSHYKEKRGRDAMEIGRNAKALGFTNLTYEEICKKYGVASSLE